jgi:hypothetical protein
MEVPDCGQYQSGSDERSLEDVFLSVMVYEKYGNPDLVAGRNLRPGG